MYILYIFTFLLIHFFFFPFMISIIIRTRLPFLLKTRLFSQAVLYSLFPLSTLLLLSSLLSTTISLSFFYFSRLFLLFILFLFLYASIPFSFSLSFSLWSYVLYNNILLIISLPLHEWKYSNKTNHSIRLDSCAVEEKENTY